jgi:TonB family protein
VFTGRGSTPKETASDADTVAYVARTKGAIGYVSGGASTEGVKILRIQAAPVSGERKLILGGEPDYPETLKQLKIGGIVRLRVTISARGEVEKVDLLGGNPILGEAASVAVRKWIYAPARSRTTAEIRIEF